MKRKIIHIDEDKCNGCGECIPNCPEGALRVIDGKVRLVSDLFCDGLGACIGRCPQGAISIEEREAEDYDERKVMANIVKQGKNTIEAHLTHLKEHHQHKYLHQALDFLKEKNIKVSFPVIELQPGYAKPAHPAPSELRQWPIQLHLVSPEAPYYEKADVLLSADCVAFTVGDFHKDYLKGKAIAIACPKLDERQDEYVEKIKSWIDDAKINTLTVMTMQVPCCMGLVSLAQQALSSSKRKIPVKSIVVSLEGDVLQEEWI